MNFGCTTTQTRESKPREWVGCGGMQTLVECATKKVPLIVISSYKETEQNTCPSPEADAGTAVLSLGPLRSKETFWRWIRLSSMKHKGLLVLRLTHIHTNNWTSPRLHFQKGQSVKILWNHFIHPKTKQTNKKKHVRTHFRSQKLGFSCYMWTRVRSACTYSVSFTPAPHVIHTSTKRGEASVLQSMYIIISAEKKSAVYNISSGCMTLHVPTQSVHLLSTVELGIEKLVILSTKTQFEICNCSNVRFG